MIYITFLGLGDTKNKQSKPYEESITIFDDLEQMQVKTNFIQIAVLKRFQSDISKILVILTKDVMQQTFPFLEKDIEELCLESITVVPIVVDQSSDFETMIDIINPHLFHQNTNIDVDKQMILDFTLGYRSIPIIMQMVIQYYKTSFDIDVKHIFYGEYNFQTKMTMVRDFADSMKLVELNQQLHYFDKTLLIRDAFGIDSSMNNFERIARELETAIHASDLHNSMTVVIQLFDEAKRMLNNKKTNLYKPFFSAVVNKIEPIVAVLGNEGKIFYNYIPNAQWSFIRLLINHGHKQPAITFFDVMIREILLSKCVKNSKNVSDALVKLGVDLDDFYEVTQVLKSVIINDNGIGEAIRVNVSNRKYMNLKQFENSLHNMNVESIANDIGFDTCDLILDFYEARNKIHHGDCSDIEQSKNIYDIMDNISKTILT